MRKHILAALAAVTVFALTAGLASTALALPTYTTPCSGCHATNAAVTVTAVPGVAGATTTPYTISVTNSLGSVGWAVFNGSTKVSSALSAGTTISLTNGVTYTIYGAGLDGSANQIGKSIVVAVPVPDLTAPTTTSDAKASYVSNAVVHLSAIDNVGGSGVAHTYYVLDGGVQAEGTTVSTSVLATHTLQFWSVDAKNNVEATKSVQFAVKAPVPDVTAPTTTSNINSITPYVGSAAILLTATDNVDGSGVAHTFYILDAGTPVDATSVNVSAIGTHTIEFWSVDASNNVEMPHNTAAFTVVANPAPVMCKFSYKFNLKKKVYKKLKAVLKSNATGRTYTVTVSKKGAASWKQVLPAGKYRLSTTGNKKFKFKARTVTVH